MNRIRDVVTRCTRCRQPFGSELERTTCARCGAVVCWGCVPMHAAVKSEHGRICRTCDAKRRGTYAPPAPEPLEEHLPLFDPRQGD